MVFWIHPMPMLVPMPIPMRCLASRSAAAGTLRACLAAVVVLCAVDGRDERGRSVRGGGHDGRRPATVADDSWAIVGYETQWPQHGETGIAGLLAVGLTAGISGGRLAWIDACGSRRVLTYDNDTDDAWLESYVTSVQGDRVITESNRSDERLRLTLLPAEAARSWRALCFSADARAVARRPRCRPGEQEVARNARCAGPTPRDMTSRK
jgi:hypothetical protein